MLLSISLLLFPFVHTFKTLRVCSSNEVGLQVVDLPLWVHQVLLVLSLDLDHFHDHTVYHIHRLSIFFILVFVLWLDLVSLLLLETLQRLVLKLLSKVVLVSYSLLLRVIVFLKPWRLSPIILLNSVRLFVTEELRVRNRSITLSSHLRRLFMRLRVQHRYLA